MIVYDVCSPSVALLMHATDMQTDASSCISSLTIQAKTRLQYSAKRWAAEICIKKLFWIYYKMQWQRCKWLSDLNPGNMTFYSLMCFTNHKACAETNTSHIEAYFKLWLQKLQKSDDTFCITVSQPKMQSLYMCMARSKCFITPRWWWSFSMINLARFPQSVCTAAACCIWYILKHTLITQLYPSHTPTKELASKLVKLRPQSVSDPGRCQ